MLLLQISLCEVLCPRIYIYGRVQDDDAFSEYAGEFYDMIQTRLSAGIGLAAELDVPADGDVHDLIQLGDAGRDGLFDGGLDKVCIVLIKIAGGG